MDVSLLPIGEPTAPTRPSSSAHRAGVNLIGEHTDYNDVFLPLAIDRDTVIAAGPSLDGGVNSVASDYADGRPSTIQTV